ncbi:MAG: hypothetical protein IPG45_05905 [Deltaproteobacteria bacterium]|nr:hypothetical protein [Deltaproteobacteria bacterium]
MPPPTPAHQASQTEAQVERAKQALGRWALLDAETRSPTETFAVVAEVVRHLPGDARAVRATVISMSKELKALRVRIDALERELSNFTEEPNTDHGAQPHAPAQAPAPAYARFPPPVPVAPAEPDIPMAEPEEVFAEAPFEDQLRARVRELSNLLDLNFPTRTPRGGGTNGGPR